MQYERSSNFYPHKILENMKVFFKDRIPFKVPDLIRYKTFMNTHKSYPNIRQIMSWVCVAFDLYSEYKVCCCRTFIDIVIDEKLKEIEDNFLTILEWKFECQSCQRFVKTRVEDFLLKIHANEPNSFEGHLNSFLQNQICSCQMAIITQPQLKQGMNLFLSISFYISSFFLTKIMQCNSISLNIKGSILQLENGCLLKWIEEELRTRSWKTRKCPYIH